MALVMAERWQTLEAQVEGARERRAVTGDTWAMRR